MDDMPQPSILNEVYLWEPKRQYIMISSDNGSLPNMRQTIINPPPPKFFRNTIFLLQYCISKGA